MKRSVLYMMFIIGYLSATAQHKTPLQLYPGFFREVQMQQIYPDGKTFPDAIPTIEPEEINRLYEEEHVKSGFSLKAFVNKYFKEPYTPSSEFVSNPANGLRKHIDTLWTVLERGADTVKNTSLIPLPYPYVVPGGRFRETYYWDSYFTMLGLQEAGKFDVIEHMVDNFAWLLDKYGLIPNGNRTYYLTRSQPPFFSLMVEMLAKHKGDSVLLTYLPQLLKEYNFWINGSGGHHVIDIGDHHLNRYYDAGAYPREESYREDVMQARKSDQDSASFYRNIRAAAESGWDFSSRWFEDGQHLSTIKTTDYIAVDLNCLLYNLENVIAKAYRLANDNVAANDFSALALKRKQGILKYCINNEDVFTDFNFKTGKPSTKLTMAMVFPLFFKIATPRQADQTAQLIETRFLKTGGVATTLNNDSGEQWDAPNGWAPLQYIAVIGLRNYGHDELAKNIALRWIKQNTIAFEQTGKLLEKYNIELQGEAAKAGGGEYPLQDGFGWTNGVLLKLMNMYDVK